MKINSLLSISSLASFTTLFAMVFISGCSSTSKQMVLSPQIIQQQGAFYAQKTASVAVTDLRASSHIIAIHQEDEPTELISANTHIDNVVKNAYLSTLKGQALTVSDMAPNTIELFINNAHVNVNQSLMKYTVKSQITLTAQVTSNGQTLTKTYNNKGSSEGVLKADLAVLERDFNQQLGKVINQIVQDSEIHTFLQ